MLLNRLFQSWKKFTHLNGRPAPRRNGRRGWIPTEALEQRVVLSAGPIYVPDGIVRIDAAPQVAQTVIISDGIAIGSSIHVFIRNSNGYVFESDYSNVDRVIYRGSEKADYFENQTRFLTNVFGNGGNDTLIGGSYIDELHGGYGDDRLEGRGGRDVLYGDPGNDLLDGGDANDDLLGGDGDDVLFGGYGDDRLYGENGNDRVNGDLGYDTLNGGAGTNILIQGPPSLVSVGDVTRYEGNSGTTAFTFQVNLTPGDVDSLPVQINFSTANGSAVSPSDYTAVSGNRNLVPGANFISVLVRGDTTIEATENFYLNINSATNATIVDGQGLGTIINDDPGTGTLAQISIGDVTKKEGNSGTTDFVFPVTVIAGSNPTAPVTISYSTASGTAISGSDFVATSDTLTLKSGTNLLTVKVKGDTTNEADESFFLNILSSNAIVTDGQGVATIQSDDSSSGTGGGDGTGGGGGTTIDSPIPVGTTVKVSSPQIVEGNQWNPGSPNVVRFKLTLSQPATNFFTLSYTTIDGTAVAGRDYLATSGYISFAIGETEKIISVPIIGDVEVELWESFSLHVAAIGSIDIYRHLVSPTRWSSSGQATILSDDAALTNAMPGVFRNGTWYLDLNGDGVFEEKTISFGLPGDQAVVGDWDGNGSDTPGVYRDGQWYLDIAGDGFNGELPIAFGLKGDKAVVGDWDGDGKDNIGIFRNGLFILDVGAVGYQSSDLQLSFGLAGDTPVAGDWDGDGKDTVGVFRGRDWYFDLEGNGYSGELPIGFGLVGDRPVVGDWDGDGRDDMGVVRGGNMWYFDFDRNGGNAEKIVSFGLPGDIPVAGTWKPWIL